MKIAIVTRSIQRSPRILAESLNKLLAKNKVDSKIFYEINAFKRLLKFKDIKGRYSYYKWVGYKLIYFLNDWIFINKLKKYDAIIISDCTPNAFLKSYYNIEKLRQHLGSIPIIYYEVFYLGNAPTQLKFLSDNYQPSIERYDWHLSITGVTEIRQMPSRPWSQIGLYLKSTGLKPEIKKEFIAIVDFAQPDFEMFRQEQIKVLKELQINYISLEKTYSIREIRDIYRKGSIYFMQSFESFGLPIAECLSCGNYIFTPNSAWPMSWRLNENPEIHGKGDLPECFIIYKDMSDLREKIQKTVMGYDLVETPKHIFDNFYKHYPSFYDGNQKELMSFLKELNTRV